MIFELFDDRKKKAGCFRLVDQSDESAQIIADIYRDDIARLLKAAPLLLETCKQLRQAINPALAQMALDHGDPLRMKLIDLQNKAQAAIEHAEPL